MREKRKDPAIITEIDMDKLHELNAQGLIDLFWSKYKYLLQDYPVKVEVDDIGAGYTRRWYEESEVDKINDAIKAWYDQMVKDNIMFGDEEDLLYFYNNSLNSVYSYDEDDREEE